jgi:hypothetical protein
MIGGPATRREILVRQGLFSAISEDLSGASPEVVQLIEQLEKRITGLCHGSLDRALRERLVREGHASLGATEPGRFWLRSPLEKREEDEREEWKKQALVEIYQDARSRYGLIHFACHCDASPNTEMYSCLIIHVAGEPMTLKVSLMSADL